MHFRYHGTTTCYHTILGKKRIHQVFRTFCFLKDYYFGLPFHCKLSPQYDCTEALYDCTEALAFEQEGRKLNLIMFHRGEQWVVFSIFCVQEETGDSTTIPVLLVRRTVWNLIWSIYECFTGFSGLALPMYLLLSTCALKLSVQFKVLLLLLLRKERKIKKCCFIGGTNPLPDNAPSITVTLQGFFTRVDFFFITSFSAKT